jgi:hypothetical protein
MIIDSESLLSKGEIGPATDLESLFVKGKSWPPASERDRFARYDIAKKIRANQYNQLWGDELRFLREDNKRALKVYLGLPWLALKKTADLMIGEPPQFGFPKVKTSKDVTLDPTSPFGYPKVQDARQESLDVLVKRTNFRQVIKEVLFDMDALGDGIFKVYKDDEGEVQIQANSPSSWIPIVKLGAIRDIQYHILFHIFRKMIKEEKKHFLYVEIHSETEIGHRIYELEHSGVRAVMYDGTPLDNPYNLGDLQDLDDFQDDYPGLKDVEDNPLGEFMVITCHNIRTSDDIYGRGSIEGDLEGILKSMIMRYSQISRILDKHADLNMVAPQGFTEKNIITGKQQFRAGGRIFTYKHDPHMTAPDIHYLSPTFDGVVQAEEEIKRFKEDIHNLLELPMAATAMEAGKADKSGTAWRLSMSPLLEKVTRLREELDWAVDQCLSIALRLIGVDPDGIYIKWDDGLPKLAEEESRYVANLVVAKARSAEGLMRDHGIDDDEIKQEMNEIRNAENGIGGNIGNPIAPTNQSTTPKGVQDTNAP